MVSEKQKKYRDTWDSKNMSVLSCKILKTEADAFSEECKRRGTNKNAVLHEAIRRFMAEAEPVDEQ